MKIEKTINDNAIFISVIDGEERGDIRNLIDFNNLERNAIILDFTKTTRINSACISDILGIYDTCIEKNIKFVISGVNEIAKNVFDCVGITKVFKL